jgi:hypothetical protein
MGAGAEEERLVVVQSKSDAAAKLNVNSNQLNHITFGEDFPQVLFRLELLQALTTGVAGQEPDHTKQQRLRELLRQKRPRKGGSVFIHTLETPHS